MKVYLVVCMLGVWASPVHSQFFYSHFTPLQAPFAPFLPQPFYSAPITYSGNQVPSVPNSYLPPIQAPVPSAQNEATARITYNLPPVQRPEYRGFGYHTDFKDGASSTVYFVTGAESESLRNFKDFPNFARKVQEPSSGKARNLASDILDANAIPDAPGKIQSILQPIEFQRLFDNSVNGIINFYTFPAGTAPLTGTNNLTTNESDITPSTVNNTQESVVEAAESIISTRILTNDIEEAEANKTSTEIPATTTESKISTATSDVVTTESDTATTETVTLSSQSSSSTSETTTDVIETTSQIVDNTTQV